MPDRLMIDYLPPLLHQTAELRALLNGAFQPETDGLWAALGRMRDEQFIQTASEEGLRRWEMMIGLPPSGSLGERKKAVLRRMVEEPPYTAASLFAAVENLCGPGRAELELDCVRCELTVRVTKGSPAAAVRDLLERWLPANIRIDMDALQLTHHSAGAFRHRDMAARTHREIREMNEQEEN